MAQVESDRKHSFTHSIINPFHMVAEQRRSAMSSIVHTIVPLLMEEIIELVRSIPQERTQQRTVEKIGEVPDPQVQKHLVGGSRGGFSNRLLGAGVPNIYLAMFTTSLAACSWRLV